MSGDVDAAAALAAAIEQAVAATKIEARVPRQPFLEAGSWGLSGGQTVPLPQFAVVPLQEWSRLLEVARGVAGER